MICSQLAYRPLFRLPALLRVDVDRVPPLIGLVWASLMERDLLQFENVHTSVSCRLMKVLTWQTIDNRCLYYYPQYLGKSLLFVPKLPDVQNPLPQPLHLATFPRSCEQFSCPCPIWNRLSRTCLFVEIAPSRLLDAYSFLAKNRLEGTVVLICFFSFSKDPRNKIRLGSLAINFLESRRKFS